MEVGAATNNGQIQTRPIEMALQGNKANQQAVEENRQDILNKMKTDPSYVPTIQEDAIIKAIEIANKKLNGGPREFEFAIHEKTKQIMVKVIDTSTKEVIKEIPPEKILDMVASMYEASGIFVDEKR